MPFVFSTLSADQEYTNWAKGGEDLPIPVGRVLIKGGANIARKDLVTPYGVVTEVSDEQMKILQTNDVFKRHEERGFIKVQDVSEDPEKVAADMEGRDKSAPLVPNDFAEDDDAKPIEVVAEKKKAGRPKGK